MVDLIIKDGTVINHDVSVVANVVIDKGKITQITKNSKLPEAKRTIDAKGKWVLPGLVDTHDHMGLYVPGTYEKQLREETAAALCGGVTTLGQFLIDSPFIESYMESISKYIDPIGKESYSNIFLVPVLGAVRHLTEIPELVKLGMTNFKFFLHEKLAYAVSGSKGKEAISEKGTEASSVFGLRGVDNGFLMEGMKIIKNNDAMTRIHAEDIEISYFIQDQFFGKEDPAAWPASKPEFAEELDVLKCCAIAEHIQSPVYFVHFGHTRADKIVNEYRGRGNKVYAEAQIFLLLFNQTGDNCKYGPRGIKTNPSARTQEHVEFYWDFLKNDFFDVIATDMAPAEKTMKLGTDLWTATTGSNLTEVWFPVMVKLGVQERGVPIEKIVKLCCYNPAKYAGLFPEKGTIQPGSDADILIFDPKKKTTLSLDMLHTGLNYNLCEGWEFEGWPIYTILGGTVAVENGKILVQKGSGKYLPCKKFSERRI